MGYIPKYRELQTLSDEELINRYDAAAEHTVVGTGFYREEIVRRQSLKQAQEMFALTKNMHHMTITITVLTIVNVLLVGYTLFCSS